VDVLDGIGDEAERIDEALVTWFQAPNSYTAEDVVEIAAHGSPVVLELLLERALESWGRGWLSRASLPSGRFLPAGLTSPRQRRCVT
jgi:tRNA U34 5-carboxymethylaminomethyl modifying GTPase MnmE/TrmE